jgi:hypothetical protein
MDYTSWVLLILASIYFLFKIKFVYYSITESFFNNGSAFTLWLMEFVMMFIVGCVIGIAIPEYGWVLQWVVILNIVGFLVYRNTIGFKDD